MMLKIILLSIGLLSLALLGLATQILLKKDGEFPNTHIDGNPNMERLGIKCVKCEEAASCQARGLLDKIKSGEEVCEPASA